MSRTFLPPERFGLQTMIPLGDVQPYADIHEERIRAHEKHDHGDPEKYGVDGGTSMERQEFDHPLWLAVLAEEFGEGVGRAIIEGRIFRPEFRTREGIEKLRAELVQLGAMTAAWIDAVDDYLTTEEIR